MVMHGWHGSVLDYQAQDNDHIVLQLVKRRHASVQSAFWALDLPHGPECFHGNSCVAARHIQHRTWPVCQASIVFDRFPQSSHLPTLLVIVQITEQDIPPKSMETAVQCTQGHCSIPQDVPSEKREPESANSPYLSHFTFRPQLAPRTLSLHAAQNRQTKTNYSIMHSTALTLPGQHCKKGQAPQTCGLRSVQPTPKLWRISERAPQGTKEMVDREHAHGRPCGGRASVEGQLICPL